MLSAFVATGNYVGASVGYRFSSEAIWPTQIHDCKAAIVPFAPSTAIRRQVVEPGMGLATGTSRR